MPATALAAHSCVIEPFSQETPRGGTLAYSVSLSSESATSSLRLKAGDAPKFVSLGFDPVNSTTTPPSLLSLVVRVSPNAQVGSFNTVVAYKEGKGISSREMYCQMNFIVSAGLATTSDTVAPMQLVPIVSFPPGQNYDDITESATSSSASASFRCGVSISASLRHGSRGVDVIALQDILKREGYLPKDIPSSGYFGPATRDAVKALQVKHGIDPLGILGPQTRAALERLKESSSSSSRCTSLSSVSSVFSSTLRLGSRGADVVALQELLRSEGYFPADVPASGYFGSTTNTAVRAFQTKHGIEAIGVVGTKTRAALMTLGGN